MFNTLGVKGYVLKAIDEMGFQTPTDVQREAIPVLLEEKDVIVQARTGTGKTVAFGIPAIQVSRKKQNVQAVILSPTRELSRQISDELMKLKKFAGLRVLTVYGGSSINNQISYLNKGIEILVGTPGRVKDLIDRKVLKLDNVKLFILDEADEMLDMGFIDDIEYIMEQLPEEVQKGFFSATYPSEIVELAERFMTEPQKINTIPADQANTFTEQFYTLVKGDRFETLKSTLENTTKTILFCKTRGDVDRVFGLLEAEGYKVLQLHGGHTQRMRNNSIDTFRRWEDGILVATDVAARGLDIKGVTHTVNYSIPEDLKMYIHRIGRTARAGNTGKAITMLTRDELRKIKTFENLTKATLIPYTDVDKTMAEEYIAANSRRRSYDNDRNGNRRYDNRRGGNSRYSRDEGYETRYSRDRNRNNDNRNGENKSGDRSYNRDNRNTDRNFSRNSETKSGDRPYNRDNKTTDRNFTRTNETRSGDRPYNRDNRNSENRSGDRPYNRDNRNTDRNFSRNNENRAPRPERKNDGEEVVYNRNEKRSYQNNERNNYRSNTVKYTNVQEEKKVITEKVMEQENSKTTKDEKRFDLKEMFKKTFFSKN